MLFMTAKAWDNRYWFEGIWNHRFLQQPFSYCQASECFQWRPKDKDHRYWFEEVCFESETTGFCSSHILNARRFNAVHDNNILGSSVLIWRSLLWVWNQCFLQQLFSYGEPCQCCPWRPEPRDIGDDLKRSASSMKPPVSAATVLLWWKDSMLSMTTKA